MQHFLHWILFFLKEDHLKRIFLFKKRASEDTFSLLHVSTSTCAENVPLALPSGEVGFLLSPPPRFPFQPSHEFFFYFKNMLYLPEFSPFLSPLLLLFFFLFPFPLFSVFAS